METLRQWLTGGDLEDVTGLRFAFETTLPPTYAIILILSLSALVFGIYSKRLTRLPRNRRLVVAALRAAIVALVTFLLLQPAFIGVRVDPDRQYVLLLFDDSKSMAIRDGNDDSRGTALKREYRRIKDDFEAALRKNFRIASYAFGQGLQRLDDPAQLTFQQPESGLESAIAAAIRDFHGIDVAAIILVSDGAQQPPPAERLDTQGIPLFTVQVGTSDTWRDLAVGKLTVERTYGDRRPVAVTGRFRASGLAGRQVTAEILNGERVVSDQILEIATNEETHETRLQFTPLGDDWQKYRFQVRLNGPAAQDDRIPQNNHRDFLVDNRLEFLRILYFAGRPNWENKFVQRALRQEDELLLTSVLRISAAETKFVYRGKRTTMVNPLFEGFNRADVDQPRYDEAVFVRLGGDVADAGKGFPETFEELYNYDLVILGDVEAQFFSENQLSLLRDFARKRGGAVLFLGGPHSFAEGDYNNTLIESMLPVLLARPINEDRPFTGDYHAIPSLSGLMSGVWTLSQNPEENQKFWENLPELAGLNRFPTTRPAAEVWAHTQAMDDALDDRPLFALQRYGNGHTAILATGSTWVWHMGTVQDDFRHQRFWRQLSRYLAQNRPDPVIQRDPVPVVTVDQEHVLDMIVRDKAYDPRTGMRTALTLTLPDGDQQTLPVDEVLARNGLYRSSLVPRQTGLYRWRFTAEDHEATTLGTVDAAFLAVPDQREFAAAAPNPEFMQQLAARSDGQFLPLAAMHRIPEQIPFRGGAQAETISRPIWHFPGFLFALILFFTLEWTCRRKGGYA